MGKNRFLQS